MTSWFRMASARTVRAYGVALCVSLISSAGPADAWAQRTQPADTAGEARPDRTLRAEGGLAPVLDVPVDRRSYRLGPGDVLTVVLTGATNQLNTATVSPEGSLVLPTIGPVDVLRATLDEAEARVEARASRYYRDVRVHLALSAIRTFKVFVVGDVPNPGVRVTSSATRLSEVLPNARQDGRLYRNVLIQRGGDTLRVDLARFQATGDLGSNPVVREGDVILVPPADRSVRIYGQVGFPGVYEFRTGETLAELLSLATGGHGFPADAADTIFLARVLSETERETFRFSRAEAMGAVGASFALRPFDGIYIPRVQEVRSPARATVAGEVRHPGTYPIVEGVTTVRQLIAMAGGLTEEAFLIGASLRRAVTPPTDTVSLSRIPPEYMRPEDLQVLQIRATGDEANVVVDFERLMENGESVYDQRLRSDDLLTIPEARGEVTVLGAVLQPGILDHVDGRRAEYFVQLAGGYSGRADSRNTIVLKGRFGTRVDADDVREIEPGDMIIVPYKRRIEPLELLQTTSAVVTTVTGLVLTFLAIF